MMYPYPTFVGRGTTYVGLVEMHILPLVNLTKNEKLLMTLSKYISPSRRNDPKLPIQE